MTFTYTEAALNIELNKIRLYIGDTESSDPLLSDEEIALVQSDFSSFTRRCAECCRLVCVKTIRRVDGKFGNLTEKSSQIFDRYKARADYFDSQGSASYPWSGGIYQSDKDENETAQDELTIVASKFRKGQMDNTQ
jgi:hypothetical protein